MGRVYETFVDQVTPAVDACVLRDGAHDAVCRVGLGLTVYFPDPTPWERGGIVRLLDVLAGYAAPARLQWYLTSMLPGWKRIPRRGGLEELREALVWAGSRPRHHFRFRVADDRHAPTYGLTYRAIDPSKSPRASYVQLVLPQDAPPDELVQLALRLANEAPFLSGVGGFVAVWNERRKPEAFQELYAWTRRYFGLDVQDPDLFGWSAGEWLPGTGWLTLVGNELAAAVGIPWSPLQGRRWEHDVSVIPAGEGLLLRAGATPTLGDLNRFDYPAAYAEVSRALAAHLDPAPRELAGKFEAVGHTSAWRRRFLEPEGWR